ncbi:MAG: DUF1513 domain-containing protein [Lautropia sp.]
MPTATDPRRRRAVLRRLGRWLGTGSAVVAGGAGATIAGGVAGGAALGGAVVARTANATTANAATAASRIAMFAAAWEQGGRYRAGLLAPARLGAAFEPRVAIDLPTRAHGLFVEPDGRLLVIARRPGDWLLRFDPSGRTAPQWAWSDDETQCNGHVVRSADGQRLFSTETVRDSGDGCIVVRDAATLAPLARWPTGGRDPHELVVTADGALWVANGGIETRPETGRVKHDLARMDSSLVRLDGVSGRIVGQWRLDDRRLGLRHLALHADGRVGIALQAEHEHDGVRRAAPVLAILDPRDGLVAVPLPAGVSGDGYGGSIAATGDGFLVSCPRSNRILAFRQPPDRRWTTAATLAEGCALAVADPAAAAWAGGVGAVVRIAAATSSPQRFALDPAVRLDNHWVYVGR